MRFLQKLGLNVDDDLISMGQSFPAECSAKSTSTPFESLEIKGHTLREIEMILKQTIDSYRCGNEIL